MEEERGPKKKRERKFGQSMVLHFWSSFSENIKRMSYHYAPPCTSEKGSI